MGSVIDTLLLRAVELKASDLHISEGKPIMVRVAGTLHVLSASLVDRNLKRENGQYEETGYVGVDSFTHFAVAESQNLFLDKGKSIYSLFEEIIPEKQKDKLKDKGECDFAYETSSGQRFRINLYQSTDGFNAAIRIIPKTAPTCDALDLPEAIRNFSKLQNGLVLITGVTGSGKSTTLASVLNEINQTRAVHIITLEDPVEYKFVSAKSLIHQREVGSDTQSFDLETIAIAVTAAETGHLVFATLHTRSAAETVNRMIDVFPEQQQRQIRVQLAGSLQAVVSQQLLPDKQGARTAAFEIMIVTPALRNLIREGKTQQMESFIQTGRQYGMQTMEAAVERLKKEGII